MRLSPINIKEIHKVKVLYRGCECLYRLQDCSLDKVECDHIKIVENIEYLGITSDQRLTWRDNIKSIENHDSFCMKNYIELETN